MLKILKNTLTVKHIFLSVFFVLTLMSFSQNYAIRNYTVEQGLPASFISAIFQDSKGYVWFGSQAGIGKFDGHSVVRYGLSDGVPLKFITDIVETKDNKLIFSTFSKGMVVYDGWKFTRYKPETDFPASKIYDMEIDSNGRVLIGTDRGVLQFLNGKFSVFKLLDYSQKLGVVRVVFEKSDNSFWLGTLNGILVYNNGTWTKYGLKDGLPNNRILAIEEDGKGNIWVGTGKGLCKFERNKWKIISEKKLFNDSIYFILNSKRYGICVATRKGMALFNGGKWSLIDTHCGLISNFAYDLFEDREGNIWIGTQSGASVLINTRIKNFSQKHGLPGNITYAVLVASDNSVWASCDKGIGYYKNGKWNIVNKSKGMFSGSIYEFSEGKNNLIWCVGDSGISVIKNHKLVKLKNVPADKSVYFLSILCDSKGRVWTGTENHGIYLYDNNNWKHIDNKELSVNASVYSFFEDSKGVIWVGFEGGHVRVFYDNKWHTPYFESFMEFSDVTDFCEDIDGNVWISTFGSGLYCDKGDVFEHYTKNNGFVEDNCTFVKSVGSKLFIGTSRGLSVYDGVNVQVFDADNGFGSSELFEDACSIDNEGKLWIGTVGGLTVFDPLCLFEKKVMPKIHFTEIKVGEKSVCKNKQLTLDYKRNNNIDFSFIGLYFSDVGSVLYRYKLDGADEEYIETVKNTVSYRKLPPGNYVFRVTAGVKGYDWLDDEKMFEFTIEPPVWGKTWFRVLAAFICFALGAFVFYYGKLLFFVIREYRRKNYFGNYKLLKKVGAGGVANVYYAFDKISKQNIALKILHGHILESSLLSSFQSEGLVCERIKHPNVIKIYKKGVEKGSYYIAMEFVRGNTLQYFIEKNMLNFGISLVIFKKLILIVRDIHKCGVIHRDLKPENIMLDVRNFEQYNTLTDCEESINKRIKVLDFGLAKYISKKNTTMLNIKSGTPMFLPPEYFLSGQVADYSIDIYSCGVIFYYMITGTLPYCCKSDDIYHLISSIIYDEPVKPSDIKTDVLPELSEFILGIIAKTPEKRITDYNFILKKIDELLKIYFK
jgi:ligand-binding sensor domain-containing protein/tRNA A-37 threonylcarbamoyl transferase component Bud32